MKKISDYAVTAAEIEECVCPRCLADVGCPCETPSGDYADHHAARVRKARSIARDIDIAGCLPEHDPEPYQAAVSSHRAAARVVTP